MFASDDLRRYAIFTSFDKVADPAAVESHLLKIATPSDILLFASMATKWLVNLKDTRNCTKGRMRRSIAASETDDSQDAFDKRFMAKIATYDAMHSSWIPLSRIAELYSDQVTPAPPEEASTAGLATYADMDDLLAVVVADATAEAASDRTKAVSDNSSAEGNVIHDAAPTGKPRATDDAGAATGGAPLDMDLDLDTDAKLEGALAHLGGDEIAVLDSFLNSDPSHGNQATEPSSEGTLLSQSYPVPPSVFDADVALHGAEDSDGSSDAENFELPGTEAFDDFMDSCGI